MRLTKLRLFDLLYRAYQAWPRFYDGVTQLLTIGQWERWQDTVFSDLSGTKILEVGVGPGKLFLRMAKRGSQVTGIELRKGMADEARRKLKVAGLDADILQCSVYNLPFKDASFDCVVLTFVLAEINDLDRAIIEMKRALKRNGKVIVIAGGMPQDKNIVARFLFKIIGVQTSLMLERDNKVYFEKHGFEVSRIDFGPFNIVNKVVAIKK